MNGELLYPRLRALGKGAKIQSMRRFGWADASVVVTNTAPSGSLHVVVDYGPNDVPIIAALSLEV